MLPRPLPQVILGTIVLLVTAPRRADALPVDQTDPRADGIEYRIERVTDGRDLARRFGGPELALLEKINRADLKHLGRLPQIVVPATWRTELELSPFPALYPAATATAKLIVVDQPSQAFAAYENGVQVYWGPVSSGRRAKPTPSGLYHLTGGHARAPARSAANGG